MAYKNHADFLTLNQGDCDARAVTAVQAGLVT